MSFDIVVAVDMCQGIGLNGTLPWRLPGDMSHFKNLTTNTSDPEKKNACIMGRKTYFSIPPKFRPLDKRVNVVLSRQENTKSLLPADVLCFKSLEEALENISSDKGIHNIYVIGGAEVYKEALKSPLLKRIFKTTIFHNYECDTFFPDEGFKCQVESGGELKKDEKSGVEYRFHTYRVVDDQWKWK